MYDDRSGEWYRSNVIESNPNVVSTRFEISGNYRKPALVISNLDEQSQERLFLIQNQKPSSINMSIMLSLLKIIIKSLKGRIYNYRNTCVQ